MGFEGLRVISLESRRAAEMETLIRKNGGEPFVAPSMREAPLEDNAEAWEFADRIHITEACSRHGTFTWVFRSRLTDGCAMPSFARLRFDDLAVAAAVRRSRPEPGRRRPWRAAPR